MTQMSTTLAMESKKYANRAKDLHTQVTHHPVLFLHDLALTGSTQEVHADRRRHRHRHSGVVLKNMAVLKYNFHSEPPHSCSHLHFIWGDIHRFEGAIYNTTGRPAVTSRSLADPLISMRVP